jgi:uncharacterized protein YodC (DUF2158 family)
MAEFNFLFELGEVVRLKGGGPHMTVNRLNTGRQVVECLWFDVEDVLHSGDFNQESLISIEDITDEDAE